MSRSRKKPFVTISKVWSKFKEKAYRHLVKRELQKVEQEIPFDPDVDFEAACDYGKMGSWGTRCGFDMPPDENDDTWLHEEYNRLQRK
jgi:hypothetical protein